MAETNYIAQFIKDQRNAAGLTQEELAAKAGVGLRFIRELEQGKTTLKMDKVSQVLELFGYQLTPTKEMDPYIIYREHLQRAVKVRLKDKRLLFGIILREIRENNEITGWKFVRNINAIAYQKTEDPELEETIDHREIERIENV